MKAATTPNRHHLLLRSGEAGSPSRRCAARHAPRASAFDQIVGLFDKAILGVTVLDIGGQDTKPIQVDAQGIVTSLTSAVRCSDTA